MKKWSPQIPTEDIKFFSYNGFEIAYRYFGNRSDKKTILFLYGFGGNSEMVSVLADSYLSKNYPVLTVDYPGHSFSPDSKKFDLNEFVIALQELLIYLNEKEILLVGYSLGGMIALKLNELNVIKINKLILLHSAASFSYSIFKKVFYRFLSFMLKVNFKFTVLNVAMIVLQDKYFAKEFLKTSREIEMHNNPKSVVEYFDNIIFNDYTPLLKNIKCKTLIIGSKLDTLATPYASKKTNEGIKDSELIILDDIGHLSIVTRPDVISELITDFFSK
ncbi:MAG TPA: alpha/beta hydrolase [Spirochaetota bacterium]|nr:alpha/beta hydrolase [Spirochaetota bacterium]